MANDDDARTQFLKRLGRPFPGEDLFDAIPDTVYFVKDGAGRYVAVNRTLADRTGFSAKARLIGCTAREVFPGVLGERIAAQDRAVLASARPIHAKLERHLYPGGAEGWCLTWKEPILGRDGTVIGLCGISRDLQPAAGPARDIADVARALDHVARNLDRPLRAGALARRAGLSAYQLDQRIRALFGISTRQYIVRARMELACSRLRGSDSPIGEVALECGYGDQAAFARQFHHSVGLTPRQYRHLHRDGGLR
ncbi:MAG: helix-turn-helix domain-containing protein [Alphaproteobacteria bacterium]|nr:helix-turn-helix domain-containing protein [Alphaproteobacteria bacterium]